MKKIIVILFLLFCFSIHYGYGQTDHECEFTILIREYWGKDTEGSGCDRHSIHKVYECSHQDCNATQTRIGLGDVHCEQMTAWEWKSYRDNQHVLFSRCLHEGCEFTELRPGSTGEHNEAGGHECVLDPENDEYHKHIYRCSICNLISEVITEKHSRDEFISYEYSEGEGHHVLIYKCNDCGYDHVPGETEAHSVNKIIIDNENNTYTIKCICGHKRESSFTLPVLFDQLGSNPGNTYDDFVQAQVFLPGELVTPLHDSNSGSSFPYRTIVLDSITNYPVIFLPEGGQLQLIFKKQEIDNHYSEMATFTDFNDEAYYYTTTDTLSLGTEVIYQRTITENGENPVIDSALLNSGETGITISDDGVNYDVLQYLEFREEYHDITDTPFRVYYCFTDIAPQIDIAATDGTRLLNEAGDGILADENNTVNSNFKPNYELAYNSNRNNFPLDINGTFLDPLTTCSAYSQQGPAYILEQWDEGQGAWIEVENSVSANQFTPRGTGGTFAVQPFLSSAHIINAIGSPGNNLPGKYRLRVEERNITGNPATECFRFYLDAGVEIEPLVAWSYHLPGTPAPGSEGMAEGKENLVVIDFAALNAGAGNYPIVNLAVYDNLDYIVQEGFRGTVPGTQPQVNQATVVLRAVPSSDEQHINPDSLSLLTDGEFAATPGNPVTKDYFPFTLTYQHFLDQKTDPGEQTYQTLVKSMERIIHDGNGDEQYVLIEEEIGTNIWNIPFQVTLVCRDWIGNEKIVNLSPDSLAAGKQGFDLVPHEGAIYTPAYCPDIVVTSVTLPDGVDPINPLTGTPLEVTFMPLIRDFTADYHVRIEDENSTEIFLSEEANPYNNQGPAVYLDMLTYDHLYRFYVLAKNANGYVTLPGNIFSYTFNRNTLTVSRSGNLLENETWNWRYRLTGDVIIPDGVQLKILPGGEVTMPTLPAMYIDRKSKIIVRSGGTLIIDGDPGGTGTYDTAGNYLNPGGFINLVPSGLSTRLNGGGSAETVYDFDGENNWGGIYFERGFNNNSYIRRARICGAYDGIILFGGSSGGVFPGNYLVIEDSLILSNYIGIHALSDAGLKVNNSVIDSNLEYGIKTDGTGYSVLVENIHDTIGQTNNYADYYSNRLNRRLTFPQIQQNEDIKNTEKGDS